MADKIAEFSQIMEFKSVIPVSVAEDDCLEILMDEISALAVPAPHYFPDDSVTDQPERVIMSEIIREKVMLLMRDEIPHGIAVTIEQLSESVTKSSEDILNISATIYCEREAHKGMIIGKKGAMLKQIGSLAREELEEFFRIRVNLQLWLKVKEDWRNREKWDQYEVAVNEMIQKTSTTFAPWHILESVDKKYARIKALRIVVEELERALK